MTTGANMTMVKVNKGDTECLAITTRSPTMNTGANMTMVKVNKGAITTVAPSATPLLRWPRPP